MSSVNRKLPKYIQMYFLEIVIAYQNELFIMFIKSMYGYYEEINVYK